MRTLNKYRAWVPIIQVATSLGYAVDPRKGGKTLAYTHPDGDTILISNPTDAARQLYYNQNGNEDKGTVIEFVGNRLNKFNITYQAEMEGIYKVLSCFTSERETFRPVIAPLVPAPFVAGRYELLPVSAAKLHYLEKGCGLDMETLEKFLPFIRLVKDTSLQASKAFANIAFPLTRPGCQQIADYALRNYGFKSHAVGSDYKRSMWIADFAQQPARTRNIFFGENPIDMMSFYQLKKKAMDLDNAVFVSYNGGTAKHQITLALQHWPKAAKHTIFDNDYWGIASDVVVAAAISGKEVSIWKEPDSLLFTAGDKKFEIAVPNLSLSAFEQLSGIRSGLHVHKDKDFKSYNAALIARSVSKGAAGGETH